MELIPPGTKINFLGNRHYAYAFSALTIILSFASYPLIGPMLQGIDFTGGVMAQILFKKQVTTAEVRSALAPLSENLVVQRLAGSEAGEEYIVRMEAPREETVDLSRKVQDDLDKAFGKGASEIRGLEMVGPKVGRDLQESAIWATVVALAMLLVYMAFRFTFTMGLGAILCLVHDLIIIYGIFVWTGKEFNLTILAAALTIIGYDINDTIVVFDRIRENARKNIKLPLSQIINSSINQTLSRTILMSFTVFLVLLALFFLGGAVIHDFSFALLVGVVVGTYSSIFVASPIVLAWERYRPSRTKRKK